MSDGRQRRAKAKDGLWKGLNPTMALAAKSFVLAFVLFAVRDVVGCRRRVRAHPLLD